MRTPKVGYANISGQHAHSVRFQRSAVSKERTCDESHYYEQSQAGKFAVQRGFGMPATVEILTIPIGSQLVSTINKRTDPPEPDSKNDFRVLLIFSENVAELTEAKITVSAVDSRNRAVSGASLVSLEGKNSVWMATIRPPQTSGIVTVTVAASTFSAVSCAPIPVRFH